MFFTSVRFREIYFTANSHFVPNNVSALSQCHSFPNLWRGMEILDLICRGGMNYLFCLGRKGFGQEVKFINSSWGEKTYLEFENTIIPSPRSISRHFRGAIFKIFSNHGGILTKFQHYLLFSRFRFRRWLKLVLDALKFK